MDSNVSAQTMVARSARTAKYLAAVALILALVAGWYVLGIRDGVSFWHADDDYTYLALAHALNLQQWIAGKGYHTDGGLLGHPGIPFYLVSWLALRLALLAQSIDFREILGASPSEAERFWLAIRIAALLLGLGGVLLIFRAARGTSFITPLAAALLFFAISPEPWRGAFIRLGIESFALPFAMLYYLSARRAFMAETRNLRSWLLFGLVGGIGYTLKLHYVVFAVAALGGLGIAWLARAVNFKELCRLGSIYIAGFLLSAVPLCRLFLSNNGLRHLAGFHLSILTHTGYYGAGDPGLISSERLAHSLDQLSGNLPLNIAVAFLLGVFLYVAVAKWRDQQWRATKLPLGVTLILSFLLALAAAIKHYQPHYLIVALSVLPALLIFLTEEVGRPVASIGLLLSLVSLPATLSDVHAAQSAEQTLVETLDRDIETIKQRPLGPGEFRLWEYRVPHREFALGFVAQYSRDPEIINWADDQQALDRSSIMPPRGDRRYAILNRRDYGDVEAVRHWEGYRPGDRIEMLAAAVLIERPLAGR